jgi:type IX secretion system PorP/SprF family membrane protein
MMKSLTVSFILLAVCWKAPAQQTIAYTQFTFNKAGMNPAASGTQMDQKYFFAAGLRRQWTSFERAPAQNFVNVSYTRRPPRSYRYWQNFSLYGDSDDAGMLGNNGFYLGYTLHWLLIKKYVLSFGVYAGVKQFTRNTGGFDMGDPAVREGSRSVLAWPDVIPGVRFSTPRSFMGASVRHVTLLRAADMRGHAISSGYMLQPTVYLDYGRRYPVTDRLMAVPAVAVQLPIVGIPVVDLNLMYYYATRVGAGFGLRNTSFLSAIVQVRFLQNMTAGFSYSYPINAMRLAAQNSFELMIGVVPYGMDSKDIGKHSVARCPNLSY